MESYWTTFVIREIQYKTTMRQRFTSTEMTVITRTDHTKTGRGVEQRELSHTADGGVNVTTALRNSWIVS